jgi:hypothetical protein
MHDNMACGVCISVSSAFETGVRKRRDTAKRAFKKRGILPVAKASVRAALHCANDHAWWSNTSPGKDDEVEQPQCEICRGYFVTMSVVKGTLDESVPCGDNCKKSHTFVCKCSCGGSAHGLYSLRQPSLRP